MEKALAWLLRKGKGLNFPYFYTIFSLLAWFQRGKGVICPICGWSFRRFLPYGIVVRENVLCPRCGSLERHRLLYLYLQEKTDFFTSAHRVLHFAPERCLHNRFLRFTHFRHYTTADLDSPTAAVKLDIQSMPFTDGSYDVVLCSHVMEHVDNDKQAMREIFRVLSPQGWAIIVVPIRMGLKKTYEDSSITHPRERLKAFGQSDHVRVCGEDYWKRLQAAGFEVEQNRFAETLGEEKTQFYRVGGAEIIYVCRKSSV